MERRYAAHVAGKGARYTRSHPPSRLLARFEYPDRAGASKAEYAIKQLTPSAQARVMRIGVREADSNHKTDDGRASEFTS